MTLLIKNVQLVDGVHEFPERADVFVAGDRISAIGNFPDKRADEVIDGQGAWLSPGFIDVNTDSDHYLTLFNYPSQQDFLRQGVTTIFGGMCGSSLAPLIYGGLESIQKWADITKTNVNWHAVAEFLETLDKRPLAVNFGTLAGHATIRRAIVHDDIRDLTKNECEVFTKVLQEALRDGAFGMSTGLAYVHARKSPEAELIGFAQSVAAVHAVYATHLRKPAEGVEDSIAETIRLARETGAKTLVSHFIPYANAAKDYETALAAIDVLPKEIDLNFDIYPSTETLVPLYTFLPEWTQTGGAEIMVANVKDEWFVSRLHKDTQPLDEDAFVVAQATGNDILVGKSLRELRDMYGVKDARQALVKLMAATNLRATILYRNLDDALIRKAIVHPRSFIASNAASFDEHAAPLRLKFDRVTATFTKFLSLVEKENIMPMKDAIRKISNEPARKFNLSGRGELREGAVADLACFKNGEIKCTVVGGKVAMKEGVFTETYLGKALRHQM